MELIQSFAQAKANALRFQQVARRPGSTAFLHLGRYFHWYYFPEYQIFAPSKFIGYANSSVGTYASQGTGTDTTRVLSRFFTKLDRPSQVFDNLLEDLASWLHSFGANVSAKTLSGTGGIYVPEVADRSNAKQLKGSRSMGAYIEGAKIDVTQSRSERSRAAREKCIEHHGLSCLACQMDFENNYGPLGAGYIHVHHLNPLRIIQCSYAVDPVKDLVPLCPNCHAMIHRLGNTATVEDLREHLTSG
jgi:5-methylcytosine-specific restriction enzyme A